MSLKLEDLASSRSRGHSHVAPFTDRQCKTKSLIWITGFFVVLAFLLVLQHPKFDTAHPRDQEKLLQSDTSAPWSEGGLWLLLASHNRLLWLSLSSGTSKVLHEGQVIPATRSV